MSVPSSASPTTAPRADREHPYRYGAALADQIETRWQRHWAEHRTFVTPNPGDVGFDPARPKFFCMDMFPYPSGAGLHVGHPEGYIATDIVCRFKRMRSFNVLHPMGWDAFGLPAEQYAIQTGVHPAITTKKAIDNFRRQLQRFGFSYDWSREIATMDPAYYRWTQWIWLKCYNAWYDTSQNKARPIDELIQDLENGHAYINAWGELVPGGSQGAIEALAGRPQGVVKWHELSEQERREFIDEQRLAYLGEQTVNWCPKLGTVLANEEVIDGRSERGSHPVVRRPLKQWMFRITAYAERLLNDLNALAWPESTRSMQAAWIGRSEGAEIDFEISNLRPQISDDDSLTIRVFTTRPDTIFGATYMVLAPEHPLVDQITTPAQRAAVRAYQQQAAAKSDVDRQADAKTKSGVFTGAYAVNAATNQPIPVWIADYVLMVYGTGAIMAVPGQDQRDWDFAKAFDLPIVRTVRPPAEFDGEAYQGEGPAINSANDEVSLNGQQVEEAKKTIIAWLERTARGTRKINYKLRDWLFSRQRYWGEPFPIVYDEQGNHYPISESHLPVELPPLEDYKPIESSDPQPLLAKAMGWVITTAGEAGVSPDLLLPQTKVKRETNTMPGWAGSCWYYLRYCDPHNAARFVGREAERYWMVSAKADGSPHIGGVDLYIGGAEHAVLHLLYARFWHKILFDLGEVSTPEPFGRLFHQGLITSFSYQRADKTLVPTDQVKEVREGEYIEIATGEKLTQVIAKMSKSLKNVVNPDDIIAEYGADTFRLYEMYMGPLEASKPWNTRDITGLFRFLQRAWRVAVDESTGALRLAASRDEGIEKQLHRTIAKVAHDIERLAFNTAIAAMIEFINVASARGEKVGGAPGDVGAISRDQLERFTLVLAPFAPHTAEELWSRLGHTTSLVTSPWPAHDQALLRDADIELPVQINGKVKGKITVPAASGGDEASVKKIALADDKIKAQLEGKTIRKFILVPDKIVNIVAN